MNSGYQEGPEWSENIIYILRMTCEAVKTFLWCQSAFKLGWLTAQKTMKTFDMFDLIVSRCCNRSAFKKERTPSTGEHFKPALLDTGSVKEHILFKIVSPVQCERTPIKMADRKVVAISATAADCWVSPSRLHRRRNHLLRTTWVNVSAQTTNSANRTKKNVHPFTGA